MFDLDANDFDERTCICGQYDMCKECCTQFVLPAIHTIENTCILMGFKKILKVYSGGRGFHVWILDDRAYNLLPSQRKFLCQRLKNQGIKLDEKVTLDPTHLKKMPMTVHATTGNIARPIGNTFDMDTDIVHVSRVTVEQVEEWTNQIRETLNK